VLRVIENRIFKLGFVLAMVAFGTYTVVDEWSGFKSGIDRLGVMAAFEAFLCVLVGLWLNLEVWRTMMRAAGSRLPVRAACRIFFIGQLGKYMPGKVWAVVTQMELGRAYKVPRQRSATMALLTMMIGFASGLFAVVVGLPFLARGETHRYWWVLLFIPVMLACLHPRVLNPVIARALRIARRPAPEAPLAGRTIARAFVINLGAWFFSGLQIWVLTARLGAHGGDALLAGIAANALAWILGFMVVFVPVGAGVREAILIATLAPLIGLGTAPVYAIALISRGVTILGDLTSAGIAALLGRGAPTAGPAEDSDPGAGEEAEAVGTPESAGAAAG
jgi:hypothetical protein